MDINKKRLPSTELQKLIKHLIFKNSRVELLGSAGLVSQQYYSDYDLYSVVKERLTPEDAYNECIRILDEVKKEPNIFLVEYKIQRKGGSMTKFYNNDTLQGAGLFSAIKKGYNTVKDKISGVLSYTAKGLNNTSTKTLQQYGNIPIMSLNIYRTPIMGMIDKAINLISLGQWQKEKNKVGYDQMFHLALIATLQNGKNIVIEKNEVVNINTSYSTSSNTETKNVPYNSNSLTLNDLINKTIASVSQKQFYDYNAFTNNCQFFINYVLQANNLYTDAVAHFVFQDVSEIARNLPSYVSTVAKGITRTGAIANKIMGKGKKKGKSVSASYNYRDKTAFLSAYHDVEYIKMDFIVRINNIFKELSIIYNLNTVDTPPSKVIQDLNTEIKDNIKDKNYFKALKRLFSLYKAEGQTKKQIPLSVFFNSEVGRAYETVSNLKAIKLLQQHYKGEEVEKKITINLKDLHIAPSIRMIDRYIKAYTDIIQREAKQVWIKEKWEPERKKRQVKKLTLKDLRQIVKDNELQKKFRGYSRWKRNMLITALEKVGHI